jgi:pimeloyl-ACP methyl ester carboxylesterase
MEKVFIKNRKGQKIAVIIDKVAEPKGLIFIEHGLSAFKEESQIETITKAFLKNYYTAVRFDAVNTFGESDGDFKKVTLTNYYEDLEDVIKWASSQAWYQEPFCLAGHSLGSISAGYYAENYPSKVKALAPISTVVSGALTLETHSPEELTVWKKTGWQISKSSSRPGIIKELPWSHMEDRLKYNLLDKVANLTMPVLLIVGENDKMTPLKHQKILYDKLPGDKELHVIKGSPHTFREPEHLKQLGEIIDTWIKNKL